MENEELFNNLNSILSSTDLKDVTAEGEGFKDLPEGYYLVEVEKAELKTSKSSGKPMVAFQFKVVDDGRIVNEDGSFGIIPKTKNRKIFKYYVIGDEAGVRRFATDMLKFEGDEEGVPLLEKECFTTSELLVDALEILIGMRVYANISINLNADGSSSSWTNLITWKRVKKLELPL